MSQNLIDPNIMMLPPSYAVYLKGGALIIPVLIKPGTDPNKPDVYLPPVVLAHGTTRIYWSLVLLSSDLNERVQFETEKAFYFSDASEAELPFLGQLEFMSPTQIALINFSVPHPATAYYLSFDIITLVDGIEDSGQRIRVSFKVDPAVSVLSDPIDIPTWPGAARRRRDRGAGDRTRKSGTRPGAPLPPAPGRHGRERSSGRRAGHRPGRPRRRAGGCPTPTGGPAG